jgi:hypothetical protein
MSSHYICPDHLICRPNFLQILTIITLKCCVQIQVQPQSQYQQILHTAPIFFYPKVSHPKYHSQPTKCSYLPNLEDWLIFHLKSLRHRPPMGAEVTECIPPSPFTHPGVVNLSAPAAGQCTNSHFTLYPSLENAK